MTVAMPSTPASYFHLLRWQALSAQHKPLVVFTPKSMLRNKRAVSKADDFTTGTFAPIVDSGGVDPAKVRRIVLTSGKVTWDLVAEREAGVDDVAILRLERYYPLPGEELQLLLAKYPTTPRSCGCRRSR